MILRVLLSVAPVQAAPITWEPAQNSTAPTDVIADGALIEAINAGATVGATTVNSVTFEGSDALLPNSSGTDFLAGQTTLDAPFDQLLGALDYGGGTATSITIGGGNLVVGNAYRVQVFFTDLRSCCSNRTMTYGDGLGNVVHLNSSGGAGSFGQHASGIFTADGPRQILTLAIASGNAHLSGYQLRTATTPPTIQSFNAMPPLIASGNSSTLHWEVADADVIELSGVGPVAAAGSTVVNPLATQSYTLTATNAGGTTSTELTIGVDVAQLEPILNEFLASNDDLFFDEDGAPSDWIEIRNPNAFGIDLGGYFLTDDPLDLQAWQIPTPTVIPGHGYLMLFASSKDRSVSGSELHTNFGLRAAGEYLALIAPDGTTIRGEFTFQNQRANISYGVGSAGAIGYFANPTPGQPNGSSFAGFVADTVFNIDRGFYDAPFTVEISSATPGATLVHTTDGTTPTPTNGTSTPPSDANTPGLALVEINQTTVLRAAAFKDGLVSTNVDTHTYLFAADILTQSGMDPDVVDDPAYRDEMVPALKSIRTLSIVADPDHLFGASTGILANTGGRGLAWERPVSVEIIDPRGGPEYQDDAGLRMHGNGSRGNAKNSLRLLFRASYGEKKLNYPLFGEDWVTQKFNTIVLRAQAANSWTSGREEDRRSTTFTQDSFAKDLQGAMGHETAGATFVHLFLNGTYWGLYNPVERPDGSFGEDHFGGDDSDYDALNRRFSVEVLSGTKTSWDNMIAHTATLMDSPGEYAQIAEYIDLDNLIDYMLLHQFLQTRDGPDDFGHNNMRLVRSNNPPGPFRLYAWDMEYSMIDTFGTRDYSYPYPIYSSSRSGNRDITDSIASVYLRLKDNNPEFRLRYADRAHRHLQNGGALDVADASALWLKRANEIESAVICESARWGDQQRAIPYTRDVEWMAERTRLLTEFFPNRPDHVITQLRLHGLYPSVDPPSFNQHGGAAPLSFPLEISAPAGTIYFTLDGTDPRQAWSGAPLGTTYSSPVALPQSSVVKSRALHNGEWSALTEARFYVGPLADSTTLVVSEILYQPFGPSEALEFLELTNISAETVDLTGVHFSAGFDFAFADHTTLGAGDRVLVVRDRSAFEAEYGTGLPIAGEFQNGTGLANDGERVALFAADGSPIRDFRYEDHLPWPSAADGAGYSLVLIDPFSNPDHADPQNWRSSTLPGGNPATGDSTAFTGTAGADENENDIDDLFDYALGLTDPSSEGLPVITTDGTFVTITYTHSLGADDVALTLEWSQDLNEWFPLDPAFKITNLTTLPVGRQTVEITSLASIFNANNRAFFRLVGELRADH